MHNFGSFLPAVASLAFLGRIGASQRIVSSHDRVGLAEWIDTTAEVPRIGRLLCVLDRCQEWRHGGSTDHRVDRGQRSPCRSCFEEDLAAELVKGCNIRRDGRVLLCMDSSEPPYAFVLIEDDRLNLDECCVSRRATRYVGEEKAEEYGKPNAGEWIWCESRRPG